jgi:hypothetical protein
MQEQDYPVVEAMEKYGGSFVQALAVCFRRADQVNRARLVLAFPEYWQQYTEMSENLKK